ncbi:MAG: glycerate dehydrogenase, partial [Gammaproteobacteria bacterium]
MILDFDSLGQGDLDLSPLFALPGMEWSLHGSTQAENLHGRIRAAEVILSNKVVLDREALSVASGLRLVVVMATGTNNVDLDAAAGQGVVVCNVRNYAVASVAEHTLGLMLALARRLPEYLAASLDGSWSQ